MKQFSLSTLLFFAALCSLRGQHVVESDVLALWLRQKYASCMQGNVLDTNCAPILAATSLTIIESDLPGIEMYLSDVFEYLNDNYRHTLNGLQYFKNVNSIIYITATFPTVQREHLPPALNSFTAIADFGEYNTGTFFSSGMNIESLPNTVTSLTMEAYRDWFGWYHENYSFISLKAYPTSLSYLDILESVSLPGRDSGILPPSLRTFVDGAHLFESNYKLNDGLEELIIKQNTYGYFEYRGSFYDLPTSIKSLGLREINFWNAYPGDELGFLTFLNDLKLPSNLERFTMESIRGYEFSIPTFNANLKSLTLNACEGMTINSLPSALESFELISCRQSVLPELPATLVHLNITTNLITQLPSSLPPNLQSMILSWNKLSILPALPVGLKLLNVRNNPGVECLPALPSTLEVLQVQNTGVSCIPNETETIKATAGLPLCIVPCGEEPRYARGKVYLDMNADGAFQPGIDKPVKNALVRIQPSDLQSTTDGEGNYEILLRSDTTNKIRLILNRPHIKAITPAEYNFTVDTTDIENRDFVVTLEQVRDLEVYLASNFARPGFEYNCTANLVNSGNIQPEAIRLAISKPADWEFVSASPAASIVTADSIIWENVDLPLNSSKPYRFITRLPATADILGDAFTIRAQINPIENDFTPGNNVRVLTDIIRGSYDPNDKLVNLETVPPSYPEDQELVYTIRFQNTGTDTAFTVVLRDTIQANLQPESIRILGASHDYVFSMKNNVATFTFENILLPDSNVNEPGSHGFVMLALTPAQGLSVGQKFENRAAILFDFNEPIITNTATTEIKLTTSALRPAISEVKVYPNPTKHSIRVVWQEEGQASLSLFDLAGRHLQSLIAAESFAEMDLSAYASGMYLLKVELNGKLGLQKIQVIK